MSLFLRFASVKRPAKTISCVKRFYWTSRSCTFIQRLGIRYFIPKTWDTRVGVQTDRTKDGDLLPQESQMIYSLPYVQLLTSISYSALAFAIIFIWIIYEPNFAERLREHEREEENEPIPEEPVSEDSSTFSAVIGEIKNYSQNYLSRPEDARPKSLLGLAMIIFFFYVRSRCVLKIYRHNNEYTTVLYQAFSSKTDLIKHTASDCCYYPKKFFNCNLMGKNVIIFSDLFVNSLERQLYTGGISQ